MIGKPKGLSQGVLRPMADAAPFRDYRPELEKQAKEKVSLPNNPS